MLLRRSVSCEIRAIGESVFPLPFPFFVVVREISLCVFPPLIRTMLFPQSVKQGQTDPRGRPNRKEREKENYSPFHLPQNKRKEEIPTLHHGGWF